MQWFKGIKTVEELRKRYRELLKKYHPDNGEGDLEAAQQINMEYDRLFADLNGKDKTGGRYETREENEQFKETLNRISGFDITIEIIGSWIWCFDAFSYKEQLKALGFTWCARKKAWAWHAGVYHRHHKEEIALSEIREKYGSQIVKGHIRRRVLEKKNAG